MALTAAMQLRLVERIQRSLHKEIIRKLDQAGQAETKDERETLCAEVFADVTGELSSHVKGAARIPGARYFYEVLSPFYCEGHREAEALLGVCRCLWGQPYVAPLYALLLHKWLLLFPEAGGVAERLKHINVLIQGARLLFWGDLHGSCGQFVPLYSFFHAAVIGDPRRRCLQQQPDAARAALLSLVASFLPYYLPPEETPRTVQSFPGSSDSFFSATPGPELFIDSVLTTLRKIASEDATLRYLKAIHRLKVQLTCGPFLLRF